MTIMGKEREVVFSLLEANESLNNVIRTQSENYQSRLDVIQELLRDSEKRERELKNKYANLQEEFDEFTK